MGVLPQALGLVGVPRRGAHYYHGAKGTSQYPAAIKGEPVDTVDAFELKESMYSPKKDRPARGQAATASASPRTMRPPLFSGAISDASPKAILRMRENPDWPFFRGRSDGRVFMSQSSLAWSFNTGSVLLGAFGLVLFAILLAVGLAIQQPYVFLGFLLAAAMLIVAALMRVVARLRPHVRITLDKRRIVVHRFGSLACIACALARPSVSIPLSSIGGVTVERIPSLLSSGTEPRAKLVVVATDGRQRAIARTGRSAAEAAANVIKQAVEDAQRRTAPVT